MLELRRMAEFLHDDEQAFADILAQKSDAELMKEQKRNEGELQKAIVRNDTVSRLTKSCMRTMLPVRSAMNGLCSYLTSMRLSEWS